MLISRYVRMMLFRRESRYSYRSKFSYPQIQRLKKYNQKDLNDDNRQYVTEMHPYMILIFLLNVNALLVMDMIVTDHI